MSSGGRLRHTAMACARWATIVVSVDGQPTATWELSGYGAPTLATIDALARLHLDARRLGWNVELTDPSRDLGDLLELAGLAVLGS